MHICFITVGDIQQNASSKRAFGLAEPLTDLGYHVSIVMQDTAANRQRMAAEAPRARPSWFPASSQHAEVMAKRRAIQELKPDVVYVSAYGLRSAVVPLRSVAGAKYIVEYSELLSAIKGRSWWRRTIDHVLERIAIAVFDGHVCASRYLENGCPRIDCAASSILPMRTMTKCFGAPRMSCSRFASVMRGETFFSTWGHCLATTASSTSSLPFA